MLKFLEQSRARAGDAGRVAPAASSELEPGAAAAAAAAPEVVQLLRRAEGVAQVEVSVLEVAGNLKMEGGVFASDFVGITSVEAQEIWASLANLPVHFVEAFLVLCRRNQVEAAGRFMSPGTGSSAETAIQNLPDTLVRPLALPSSSPAMPARFAWQQHGPR